MCAKLFVQVNCQYGGPGRGGGGGYYDDGGDDMTDRAVEYYMMQQQVVEKGESESSCVNRKTQD